jgi:hypothetical protein
MLLNMQIYGALAEHPEVKGCIESGLLLFQVTGMC